MLKSLRAAVATASVWLLAGYAVAEGDASKGESVFKKCKACHAVGEGAKNKIGPQLNDLFGRDAGSIDGYKYSKAMIAAGANGLIWNEATIGQFLAKPKSFLKGTKMAFAGLKKDADIANLVAYLATFSEGSATLPSHQETKASAKRSAKVAAELKTAKKAAEPVTSGAAATHGIYRLGRPATAEEIAAWNIDIRPDGAGLPEGRGTVMQGETIYEENCANCHGDFGEAIDRWPVLAGGFDTLTEERPEKTIGSYWPHLSTVFDYVRRAMPFGDARSLSDDDVYALTAYLLYLNDLVPDEEFELSNENFSSIAMPNSENFIADDRAAEIHYANKSEPCMADCKPGPVTITMRARVLDVTPDAEEENSAAGID